MNKQVEIYWTITDHCTGGCSYCPSRFWAGTISRHITEYIDVAKKIIAHYGNLNIGQKWFFDGGEPLEFFDFPELLKTCKTDQNSYVHLTTAGGKMWLNWWAVEPHIDFLDLTYHYWQNPNLINFIVQIFQTKKKNFSIKVPIRHDFFEEDFSRATRLEDKYNLFVQKQPLYKWSEPNAGLYSYTDQQLLILFGEEWFNKKTPQLSFAELNQIAVDSNPSYTGKLCNGGIETLYLSPDGWIQGSQCSSHKYGNIFQGCELPTKPSVCTMQACTNNRDQQIKKF